MDWTVSIEVAGDLAAEQVDLERVDALADYHAVTTAARRRYGAQFDVHAPTAERATEAALSTFCAAAHKVGLPGWPVVHVELMMVDDQQAALEEPAFPDVLGVTEAAQMLGVSRQRLAQLEGRRDFPEPMVRLAAGPGVAASSIEGFERRWDRRPGRPTKAMSPAAARKAVAATVGVSSPAEHSGISHAADRLGASRRSRARARPLFSSFRFDTALAYPERARPRNHRADRSRCVHVAAEGMPG